MRVEHDLNVDGARLKKVEIDYDLGMAVAIYEEEKWKPRDGEFATLECKFGEIVSIIGNGYDDDGNIRSHVFIGAGGSIYINDTFGFHSSDGDTIRQATTEEKGLLLSKLAEQGKIWNPDKKCVDDFYVPKDGDFITVIFGLRKLTAITNGVVGVGSRSCYGYALLNSLGDLELDYKFGYHPGSNDEIRPATNEEIALLLSELAKAGKAWDFTTKTIIDL